MQEKPYSINRFLAGILMIAINQSLEVTLVTIHGQVESATFTLMNPADSALLYLGYYAAIGIGFHMFGRRWSTYHGSLPKTDARLGS